MELGYVDPLETAAVASARRLELKSRLDQAVELKRQGRGPEAAALLTSLTSDEPDWAAPHLLLAEIHYAAGRWRDVEAELEWLAHHGADWPAIALMAAGAALTRRDVKTALAEAQYAREADPDLPSAATMLGSIFLRLQRWDDAEDAFRDAVAQDPDDARARDGLATVYLYHHELEDAAECALQALAQDMRLFRGHYHLGLALAWLGRPEEAIAALENAARVDDSRIAPYYWLSRIAREQRADAPRAEAYRSRGIEVIRQRRKRRDAGVTST